MTNYREIICKRIALFFDDGDLVNLGAGIPTKVANFVDHQKNIMIYSDNGFIGTGPSPKPGEEDKDIVDAGGMPSTIIPGGSIFDVAMAFAIIRGGHVDYTVLGALEVDQEGNLANFMIPGKFIAGMGGAMDLAIGAHKVIVAMRHTTKDGLPKILKKCSLPLTAAKQVDFVVTEMGVMEITEKGIVLRELAKGVTVDDIQSKTQAKLILPDKSKLLTLDSSKMQNIEMLSGYHNVYKL